MIEVIREERIVKVHLENSERTLKHHNHARIVLLRSLSFHIDTKLCLTTTCRISGHTTVKHRCKRFDLEFAYEKYQHVIACVLGLYYPEFDSESAQVTEDWDDCTSLQYLGRYRVA